MLTFTNLLSEGTSGVARNFTHIAVYTSSLLALLNTQAITPPLASGQHLHPRFPRAHRREDHIALGNLDFARAKQAYNAVPLSFAKVLIQKPSNTVLCRHGLNEYVDMCIQQVRQINAGKLASDEQRPRVMFRSRDGKVSHALLLPHLPRRLGGEFGPVQARTSLRESEWEVGEAHLRNFIKPVVAVYIVGTRSA
jgi:hypothetical protein